MNITGVGPVNNHTKFVIEHKFMKAIVEHYLNTIMLKSGHEVKVTEISVKDRDKFEISMVNKTEEGETNNENSG